MFRQDVAELGHEVFSHKDCSTLFYQAISLFHSAITALKYTVEIPRVRSKIYYFNGTKVFLFFLV